MRPLPAGRHVLATTVGPEQRNGSTLQCRVVIAGVRHEDDKHVPPAILRFQTDIQKTNSIINVNSPKI